MRGGWFSHCWFFFFPSWVPFFFWVPNEITPFVLSILALGRVWSDTSPFVLPSLLYFSFFSSVLGRSLGSFSFPPTLERRFLVDVLSEFLSPFPYFFFPLFLFFSYLCGFPKTFFLFDESSCLSVRLFCTQCLKREVSDLAFTPASFLAFLSLLIFFLLLSPPCGEVDLAVL